VLSTVINNGLRAGWLSLGHGDGLGDALPMLEAKNPPRVVAETEPSVSGMEEVGLHGGHDIDDRIAGVEINSGLMR
jgi:hypothetical protein